MNDFLHQLNESQRLAVAHKSGPLLILAGAGSGKTRVITHRIVNLIENGVSPNSIMAVTFTNKAAKEMRDRVLSLIESRPKAKITITDGIPLITTFHSFGVKILREYHHTLGISKYFTIYDRNDSIKAVKNSLEKAGYDPKQFQPRSILGQISNAKNSALDLRQYKEKTEGYKEQVTAEVWEHYDQILRKDGALDFDDLLIQALYLIKNNQNISTTLQERFQYLHVDEYQDTNKVQFLLAKQLSGKRGNICVVGDVDQNIYSWRGADIANVLKFEKSFPGAKTIFLEENYRSSGNIISASNAIIEKNLNRIPKKVFTNNPMGEKIRLFTAQSEIDEADYVAETASELIADGIPASSIAVLFRANFQSRTLEESFLRHNLPYQLIGIRFFERKEIKDVLSYLRLALNPQSQADLSRIINVPARGIGKVTLLKILSGNRDTLNKSALAKVEGFEKLISELGEIVRHNPISHTIKEIIDKSGLKQHFKKNGSEEDMEKMENLQELVTLATYYDGHDGHESSAVALLEHVALQSDQDEIKESTQDETDRIRAMTIHAAKGLEFSHVFITGLEEGLLPHERLDEKKVDNEEERRLFYVALTRAEKQVFLSYAQTRTIFGSRQVQSPSSFLSDLDDHLEPDPKGQLLYSSGFEKTIFLD